MQTYPVRASHRGRLRDGGLLPLATECFGTARADGPEIVASFGALVELRAHPEAGQLAIQVRMDPKVAEPIARETIQRYNRFLEQATGYSSKERARRLKKSGAAKSPAG